MGPAHQVVHCPLSASHTACGCAASGRAGALISIGESAGTCGGTNGGARGFSRCGVGSRWFEPDPDPPTAAHTPSGAVGTFPGGDASLKGSFISRPYGGGPFPYMARMRELHVACCRAAHALPRTAHSISSTRTAKHTDKARASTTPASCPIILLLVADTRSACRDDRRHAFVSGTRGARPSSPSTRSC